MPRPAESAARAKHFARIRLPRRFGILHSHCRSALMRRRRQAKRSSTSNRPSPDWKESSRETHRRIGSSRRDGRSADCVYARAHRDCCPPVHFGTDAFGTDAFGTDACGTDACEARSRAFASPQAGYSPGLRGLGSRGRVTRSFFSFFQHASARLPNMVTAFRLKPLQAR